MLLQAGKDRWPNSCLPSIVPCSWRRRQQPEKGTKDGNGINDHNDQVHNSENANDEDDNIQRNLIDIKAPVNTDCIGDVPWSGVVCAVQERRRYPLTRVHLGIGHVAHSGPEVLQPLGVKGSYWPTQIPEKRQKKNNKKEQARDERNIFIGNSIKQAPTCAQSRHLMLLTNTP